MWSFRKKYKNISCVFLLLFFTFLNKCSECQIIFFRAFRDEVFFNASAKSSHSGGPLGRHQVVFSQNSMKFYQNWIGSFSAVSTNFWVLFFAGDASNWPLRRAEKSGVLEKNQKIFHVFSFCCFFTFLANFLGIFDFLALLSARSRRVLANREERIKKENFLAFFWPVEIGEILVRLLIVKVNKLVYIITRRNRLGSGWDFNSS